MCVRIYLCRRKRERELAARWSRKRDIIVARHENSNRARNRISSASAVNINFFFAQCFVVPIVVISVFFPFFSEKNIFFSFLCLTIFLPFLSSEYIGFALVNARITFSFYFLLYVPNDDKRKGRRKSTITKFCAKKINYPIQQAQQISKFIILALLVSN